MRSRNGFFEPDRLWLMLLMEEGGMRGVIFLREQEVLGVNRILVRNRDRKDEGRPFSTQVLILLTLLSPGCLKPVIHSHQNIVRSRPIPRLAFSEEMSLLM